MKKVAFTLVLALGLMQAAYADFGAIAYSVSTGNYGYSYQCQSRGEAERIAVNKAGGGHVRVWVENGYAALALGRHGRWGTGLSHHSRAEAEAIALRNCGEGAHIACWLSTGR